LHLRVFYKEAACDYRMEHGGLDRQGIFRSSSSFLVAWRQLAWPAPRPSLQPLPPLESCSPRRVGPFAVLTYGLGSPAAVLHSAGMSRERAAVKRGHSL
jgi:hypothetical protein